MRKEQNELEFFLMKHAERDKNNQFSNQKLRKDSDCSGSQQKSLMKKTPTNPLFFKADSPRLRNQNNNDIDEVG